MFKKEAEEYIKKENLEWELECYRVSPINAVTNAYQDGATFGYNKAKEELEVQIEKMKKYIKACWVEENLNDYSSYITNTSDEFRDLVKELNNEVKNGR